MLSLSRRVFSAQDGPRKKNLKYVQNRLEMSFLNMFLKILYDVLCSQNSNENRQTTCQQRKKGSRV